MKTIVKPIPLKPAKEASETRLVKSVALTAFLWLRAGIDVAMTVPAAVSQAASDIGEAWDESAQDDSRPNV